MLGINLKTKGLKNIKKFVNDQVKHIDNFQSVKIGYFNTARYPNGTSVASVAVRHEFGDPYNELDGKIAPIPARPTMRPALIQLGRDVSQIVKRLAEMSQFQTPKAFVDILPKYIGAYGTGLIQLNIAELKTPRLSPTTLEIRRTRDVNQTSSDKPLIDTATMRLAVSWQIGSDTPSQKDTRQVLNL